MNILMLTSGTIHSSLSHRLLSLAKELVKSGHDVTILAPSQDKYSKFQPDVPTEIEGVKLVYPRQFKTRSYPVNLLPYLFSSLWHVLRSRADIVYIYKPTPITITGLAARFFKRTPTVLDMDDLGSEVMHIEHQPAFLVRLVAFCERLAARHANAIVAASTLLEQEFRAAFPAKPILRLPNGVNPAEFTALSKRTTPHLIFFGALNRKTILEPVLQALPGVIARAGSSPVHLDILGDGTDRAYFETLAARLGVTANVTFHGWTNFAQLNHLVSPHDIALCIMPNERTTAACSNQKVFQYMALGTHVVATTVGDLPIYLENGAAGTLVEAGNTSQLSDTLANLLTHESLRTKAAHRGQALARTTYAWSTLNAQIEDLLRTLHPGAKA